MSTVTGVTAARAAAMQAEAEAYADSLFAGLNGGITTLTDASTIAVNCDTVAVGAVTLGGNRTLGNPTGTPTDGQSLMFRVRQDGTGSRTLGFGSAYRFGTDISSATLTTTAGKTDYIGFKYNAIDAKWDCLAFAKGY